MMVSARALVAAAVAAVVALATQTGAESVSSLEVQHAFGAQDWQERGSIVMSSDTGRKTVSLKFAQVTYEFNDAEREAFDEVLSKDSFYRVRIRTPDDASWMTTSIPACLLAASNYMEVFRFHFDKSGTLATVDYKPTVSSSACDVSKFVGKPVKLKSRAEASLPTEGYSVGDWGPKQTVVPPNAPGQPAQPAAASGQDSQDGEEKPEEQHFLRKYWYILLPIAVMSFLSPAPPEEGGAPAAGGNKGKK
ncbi:ER membrane protein complex subunit 10 [Hondaea fermentalgiana]|uniref:ER membrane protein complex subunit 10 n=1 Tax=Hondaea fermentalgiana TaxID=2315210 RepID=A0A2R5G8R8_9STRA|nr:ER membrane protein complex subunit 10 [Hondaea fermentalgiana]|eukprot:GBG24054.1 ER membrane protein complex subunit 10 [Hondaea fermentalgiana]